MDAPLLYPDDEEPTDDELHAAQIAALRGKSAAAVPGPTPMGMGLPQDPGGMEAMGILGQLTGDRVLSPVGTSVLAQAHQQRQMAEQQQEKSLTRALAARKERQQETYQTSEADDRNARLAEEKRYHDGVLGLGQQRETNKRAARVAAAGAGDGFSSAALDQAAEQYTATGVLPSFGQGKAGAALRLKVANRAAELHGDASLAGNKADYGADKDSLKHLQRQADATEQFENTALSNLNTFLDQAKGVVDTGSPFFNAPARKLAQQFAGNPKMAAFNASREVAVNEISKVLSGSTGAAAVSDSARHEAASLLGPDASLAQIQAAAQILKTDMANRKKAVNDGIAIVKGRIAGHKAPPATGPAAAAGIPASTAAPTHYLVKGNMRIAAGPDGKPLPGAKPEPIPPPDKVASNG